MKSQVSATAAPWLVGLAVEGRGFPVPAESPWEGGRPLLSRVGLEWRVALGFLRACAVCGLPLKVGRRVYRAFAQGDAGRVRGYERESTQDVSGPGHRSCMVFSAMVCPYLKESTSRLGKGSGVAPGAARGKVAAVLGFEDAAILVYAREHGFLDPGAPQPRFAYRHLVEDIRFQNGQDLAGRYEEAVAADEGHIDTSAARGYWRSGDDPALVGVLERGRRALAAAGGPLFRADVLGQPYGGFLLPVLDRAAGS